MENIELQMNDYINKLMDKYLRANSASKKRKTSYDLITFSRFYNSIFPNKKLPWNNDSDILREYYVYNSNIVKEFLHNLEKDKDIYRYLSKNVIDSFAEVNYPFYKSNYKIVDLPRLTTKESSDIILSFLNDFSQECYLKMLEMVKNNELFGMPNLISSQGQTVSINSLKKNFIIISDIFDNSIFTNSVTMHEFGHSYEFYISNATCSQILETPFYEVASCFFEYAFLNYLKEKKMYMHSVDICLDIFYKNALYYNVEMNLLNDMPDIYELEDYELDQKRIEEIKQKLNYYDLFITDEIIYANSYIYGIGHLFAVLLYDNYKQDKEKFNYNFKNMLTSYPFANSIESFKPFNITEEELESGKILRKTLKNFTNDFLTK